MNKNSITILASVIYSIGLILFSLIVPRDFYIFLLFIGLCLISVAFYFSKHRLLTAGAIVALILIPWIFSIDVAIHTNSNKIGIFVMPIKHSLDASVDKGSYPGGDIVGPFPAKKVIVICL